MYKAKFFYLIENGKVVRWMSGSVVDYDAAAADKLDPALLKPAFLGVDQQGNAIFETDAERDARVASIKAARMTALEAEKASRTSDPTVTENAVKAWVSEAAGRSYIVKDHAISGDPTKYLVYENSDVRRMTDQERRAVDKSEKDADQADRQSKRARRQTAKQKLKALNFTNDEAEEILGGKD